MDAKDQRTVVVFTSSNLPEISMISSFLEEHGIENEITNILISGK